MATKLKSTKKSKAPRPKSAAYKAFIDAMSRVEKSQHFGKTKTGAKTTNSSSKYDTSWDFTPGSASSSGWN